jgi:curli biogenesis system outer membrane secretion channel CsgG
VFSGRLAKKEMEEQNKLEDRNQEERSRAMCTISSHLVADTATRFAEIPCFGVQRESVSPMRSNVNEKSIFEHIVRQTGANEQDQIQKGGLIGLKRGFYGVVAAMWMISGLSSCATIEKPEIKQVEETPKATATVQQVKAIQETKRGLKRKVAIGRFTNETKYGQSFFIDKNNDRIGKQAVDILSSKLVETEKFILIERADLDKIEKELRMEDYGPLKNMADYLIVGSVTEFGRKDQGQVGVFSRTRRQVAFARVHIRLIEVRTGQILYSEEGEGQAFSEAGTVLGVGERAGYDSSINDKALDGAITNLASNIIQNLLDRPWRSYIIGYEDGNVIIAGGRSQNIKEGDTFQVIQEGKKVKNPQTNMMINLPGKHIATLKSVMLVGDTTESEVTLCQVVSGDLNPFLLSKDFSALYVQEE